MSAVNVLQDKIRRTIGTGMDERIGRNLLLGNLDGKPLEYSISRSAFVAHSFEILATRSGVVREVYLDRLFDFANELEEAANQSGYSFEEQQSTEGRNHNKIKISRRSPNTSWFKNGDDTFLSSLAIKLPTARTVSYRFHVVLSRIRSSAKI